MKKILLIDDDVVLQKIYQDRLTHEGFEMLAAGTGQLGLTTARDYKPDLILLDAMLPEGMNGFDVLEQLKREPELKDIPVIMLTNLDSEEKTARGIGAIAYLSKGKISLEDLVKKLRSVLT